MKRFFGCLLLVICGSLPLLAQYAYARCPFFQAVHLATLPLSISTALFMILCIAGAVYLFEAANKR